MSKDEYIVCGFYTSDYGRWLVALTTTLERHHQPHDLVSVAKIDGGWEANTRQKPAQVQNAMLRHPDKVVIFVDVDCIVRGDLSPLADLSADVAVYLRGKRRRNGGYRMHARSGTIVLKPTQGARDFVARWIDLTAKSQYGDVDQLALTLALGDCPNTSFQPLDERWCGTDPSSDAVIVHDRASATTPKIGRFGRLLHRITQR